MLWFFTAGSVQYLHLLTLQKKKNSNDEVCLYRETKGRRGSSWLPICTTARYQLGNLHICYQKNRITRIKLMQLQWFIFYIYKREIISLCPQSRSGPHHSSNEKVLRRQSLLFLKAFTEQVWLFFFFFLLLKWFMSCCSHSIMYVYLSSSGTSTTSVVCSLVPSKWTAVHCSSIRFSFHHSQTSRQEVVSLIHTSSYFYSCQVWLINI